MQKIILIFILLLCISCSFLPDSIGKSNEIIVITSPEDKIHISPLLSNVFSHIINTPQIEKEFILQYRNPWELEKYKEYANIMIISLDYPEDSSGDLLTKKIIKKQNQVADIMTLGDLYAKNQLFCLIHVQDAVELENILKENGEWILKEFINLFEKRMLQGIFKYGKNTELSNKIFKILGHTIELQRDFKLIRSDTLNSFIWLGRGYPYRWLTLHKSQKDSFINIKSSWEQLKNDYAKHMPEIKISNHFQKNEKIYFDNNKLPIMRGIYEHSESDTGGPFFVYIFDTEQSSEVILISGFVNYPGHEKILLLKQLEIMAKTIYKGEPE